MDCPGSIALALQRSGFESPFRSFLLLPYTFISKDHTNPLSFSPLDFNFESNLIKYHIFQYTSQLFLSKASLKFYLSLICLLFIEDFKHVY